MPGARKALKGVGNQHIDIPSGGGTWTAASKKKNADVVAGILRECMQPASGAADPALERNALELENLMRAARVEFSLIDFKQGLSRLSDPPCLEEDNVTEIARTLSAMANHGRDARGYVLVGIADVEADAKRVEQLGGGKSGVYENRFVTGLDLDVGQLKSLDDLLLWFTNKIQDSDLHKQVCSQVLRDMRAVPFMGKTVLLLRLRALDEPVPFGNTFYERQGSQTVEVPGAQVARLFARFR